MVYFYASLVPLYCIPYDDKTQYNNFLQGDFLNYIKFYKFLPVVSLTPPTTLYSARKTSPYASQVWGEARVETKNIIFSMLDNF